MKDMGDLKILDMKVQAFYKQFTETLNIVY